MTPWMFRSNCVAYKYQQVELQVISVHKIILRIIREDSNFFGGHKDPILTVGDILLWKRAQKTEIKNNTLEIMNRIILHRSPLVTNFVTYAVKPPVSNPVEG